jgi:hypothetical protein
MTGYSANELWVLAALGIALLVMCGLDAILTRWPGEDRLARWLHLDLGDD